MKVLQKLSHLMLNGGFFQRFLVLSALVLPIDLVLRFEYLQQWGLAGGLLAIIGESVSATFIFSVFDFGLFPSRPSKVVRNLMATRAAILNNAHHL
jgi:hypothetical protein